MLDDSIYTMIENYAKIRLSYCEKLKFNEEFEYFIKELSKFDKLN